MSVELSSPPTTSPFPLLLRWQKIRTWNLLDSSQKREGINAQQVALLQCEAFLRPRRLVSIISSCNKQLSHPRGCQRSR